MNIFNKNFLITIKHGHYETVKSFTKELIYLLSIKLTAIKVIWKWRRQEDLLLNDMAFEEASNTVTISTTNKSWQVCFEKYDQAKLIKQPTAWSTNMLSTCRSPMTKEYNWQITSMSVMPFCYQRAACTLCSMQSNIVTMYHVPLLINFN